MAISKNKDRISLWYGYNLQVKKKIWIERVSLGIGVWWKVEEVVVPKNNAKNNSILTTNTNKVNPRKQWEFLPGWRNLTLCNFDSNNGVDQLRLWYHLIRGWMDLGPIFQPRDKQEQGHKIKNKNTREIGKNKRQNKEQIERTQRIDEGEPKDSISKTLV